MNNKKSYQIQKTKFGILVFGPIPIPDFANLVKSWSKKGYTKLHVGIAQALNATFAITSEKNAIKWEEEIKENIKEIYDEDKYMLWLKGTDTGISSKTIFSVLAEEKYTSKLVAFTPDTPKDPSDFGRCYRLLEEFPEWRQQLQKVADKYPEWQPLIDNWTELEMLYNHDVLIYSSSGKKQELLLYDKMQELMSPLVTKKI